MIGSGKTLRLSFLGLGIIFVVIGLFSESLWPFHIGAGASVASLFPGPRRKGSAAGSRLRFVGLVLAVILVISSTFADYNFSLMGAGALIGIASGMWGRLPYRRDVISFLVPPLIPTFAAAIWAPSSPLAGLPFSYVFMIFFGCPSAAFLAWIKARAWWVYGAFGLPPGLLAGYLAASVYIQPTSRQYLVALSLFGGAGFLTALCYWFIGVRGERKREHPGQTLTSEV